MFDEIIKDSRILANRYIERQGFIFTSITYPSNIYDAIVLKNVCNKKELFQGFPNPVHTFEEHLQFINKHKLEKAIVFTENLDFLYEIPTLKYLRIVLENEMSDYASIYSLPEVKSIVIHRKDYGSLLKIIDYSKIKGLQSLHISGKGHLNYEKVESLKTLAISDYKKKNLRELFSSKQLDTLSMTQCKINSLDGIEQSDYMQCVYLQYNRLLSDISALKKVKETLKALRIENCPKIEDFSVLYELENLELLELTGKNELPDLQFIKYMKRLKTFIFDMNVLDGDLTPCLDLSYVYSRKNRKHYNLKDKDMPRGKYVRGNENIELWRRLE